MVEEQQKTAPGKGHAAATPELGLGSAAADQKIAELETQLQEATERALRTQAELENYRKRTQREMADEAKYAEMRIVRDLLPVVDNLQRAIEASQHGSPLAPREEFVSRSETPTVSGLLEGVKLVAAQLEAVLKQHHCVPIEAVGQPFDPNQHQAIVQEPSAQYPAGTVTRVAQVGYKLHDRVIRPAQVFVSTGPA